MRERTDLWMDGIAQGLSNERPSGEFEPVGVLNSDSEAALTRSAKVAPAVRPRMRLAGRLMGALLLAVAVLAAPAASQAGVAFGVVVSFGPPALPFYAQPLCPGPGYIWTPGYWAWDPDYGYYWVPGTWVMAPFVGALWTPGYWAFDDGGYVWYPGYWGPVVGFYGGIDYGYGYTGYGYEGGYWRDRDFYYNRAVSNVRTSNVTYVYNKTVVNNASVTRVSYNGGPHGTRARPTAQQMAAARQRRFGPVEAQQRQIEAARRDPAQRARENKGRPEVAATRMPGEFSGHGSVRASRAGAPYRPPEQRAEGQGRKMEANPHSMPAHPSARPPRTYEPRRAEPRARTERTVPPRQEAPQVRVQRHSNPPPFAESHRNMNRPQQTRRLQHPAYQQPRVVQRQQPHGNVHASRGRGSERQHKPPHGFGR